VSTDSTEEREGSDSAASGENFSSLIVISILVVQVYMAGMIVEEGCRHY
jgi:hypothetical protein